MGTNLSSFPDYDNPPVIEVVFGIQFKEISLQAPHTGILWQKLDRDEFPEFQEMPPLRPIVEFFGERSVEPKPYTIEQVNYLPLPRLLFINKQANHLIQIQQDRFLQNWRKLQPDDKYPRYVELFPKFTKTWRLFSRFIEELRLNTPEPNQYELTYINHIPRGDGWKSLADISRVFPDFQCRVEDPFLPEPETLGWRRIFRFPENKGRLHVSLKQVISRQTKDLIMVLVLTARGFTSNSMDKWFDMAHEWIVRGFTDLTNPKIQESIWKRKI